MIGIIQDRQARHNVELIRAYGIGSVDWLAKYGLEGAVPSDLRLGFLDLPISTRHNTTKR